MTGSIGSLRRSTTVRVAAACAVVLVVLAIGRVIAGGWDALSADHARYVYAGLSLIDGRGYVNESGDPFLFRAPAFALLTGVAWQLAGSAGAHLATWGLGVASLLLAVALAARLGGAVAAVAATASIVAVPLFWEQIVGLGIDQPQATFLLGAVLLFGEAATIRWVAAGVLLGLGILVKETLAPAVVLLPVAWLPLWTRLGWARWVRLCAAFGLTVALVAGWWWIVVWGSTGDVFPLNALRAIVPDDVPLELTFPAAAVVGAVLAALAWATVIATRATDPQTRALLLGALATLPAVVATIALAQAPRNLTAFLLLTCVAVGVAASEVWTRLRHREADVDGTRFDARIAGRIAGAGLVVLLATLVLLGQASVRPPVGDALSSATADVLRPRLDPADHVVSTFRGRSTLGVELFGQRTPIELVPARAVSDEATPSDYLWLGVRNGTLFGIERDRWRRVVGAPGATFVVIAVPHALSPAELVSALRGRQGRDAGLSEVARIDSDVGTSYVFANEPARAKAMDDVALHAAPGALLLWLDQARARGEPAPVAQLLASTAVIPENARGARLLARRLGDRACFQPAREGGRRIIVIERRLDQVVCLDPTQLK